MFFGNAQDIIAAIATPPGMGAIGIVRVSGEGSIALVDKAFKGQRRLQSLDGYQMTYGHITDADGSLLDEVIVAVFKAPKSYTGEESVEVSCHGSPVVLQSVLRRLIHLGARQAQAGEFTQRAFLNGQIDLAQAEAVADLIHAESQSAQKAALNQLKGGFSNALAEMREQLLNFVALIELELDFAEEDVEFADRSHLHNLIEQLIEYHQSLMASFTYGNAVKAGLGVAIIGAPNAGKSTLLNALIQEDRAIVSNIAGTTRDSIEERLFIHGLLFRIIDTAGIRTGSADEIENIGIDRALTNAQKADLIIHLIDATAPVDLMDSLLAPYKDKTIVVYNKADLAKNQPQPLHDNAMFISAQSTKDVEMLKQRLFDLTQLDSQYADGTIVTNMRHYSALQKSLDSLLAVRAGMAQGLSGDLLSLDIRRSLHYLGEITGQVEVDRDILGTIFGKFCIGK